MIYMEIGKVREMTEKKSVVILNSIALHFSGLEYHEALHLYHSIFRRSKSNLNENQLNLRRSM